MSQEKRDRIHGIGLVLSMDKTFAPGAYERSILSGSAPHDDFDNVIPEPKGSPLSEIIDPEMANWEPPIEKKRKAKPKRH